MTDTVIPPEVEQLLEAGGWQPIPSDGGGLGWFRWGIRGSGMDFIWSRSDEDFWVASHHEKATLTPNMMRVVDVTLGYKAADGEKADDDGMSVESFPSLEECLKGCDSFFKNPFVGRGSHIDYVNTRTTC